MNKYIIIFFLVISSFILVFHVNNTSLLYAKLRDFKESVNKERNKNKNSGSRKSNRGSGTSSSIENGDDDSDSCMGEMAKAVFHVWMGHNLSPCYAIYPYATDLYIDYSDNLAKKKNKKQNMFRCHNSKNDKKSEYRRKYFFTFDMGGQHTTRTGDALYLSLGGKFIGLIGPEIEVFRRWDGDDHMEYYAGGINIGIIQVSPFMLNFYIQRSAYRGILKLTGWSYGFTLYSMISNQFSVFARFGWRDYNYILFHDYEGRIGYFLHRFELYAGYRYYHSEQSQLQGFIGGIKFWL